MKKLVAAKKYLSVGLAVAAFAAAGSVSAFAQSRDHTGSMMPAYYDENGAQKTGAWSKEEEAGAANKQAALPGRSLYLYAGKRLPHHGARVH